MAFPCKMLKKGVPFPKHSFFLFPLARVCVFVCDAKLHFLLLFGRCVCILSQIAIKTVCLTGHSPCLLQHFIFDALSVSSLSFRSILLPLASLCWTHLCFVLSIKSKENANSLILWIFIFYSPKESFTSHTKNESQAMTRSRKMIMILTA